MSTNNDKQNKSFPNNDLPLTIARQKLKAKQ